MVVEDPASAALPRRWQQSATTARKTIGGEEVEDFGLGASALRVDSHHLPSSGQDTREKGHLGRRTATCDPRGRGSNRWSLSQACRHHLNESDEFS